ncbi:MAG: hypothetical protein ACJAUD_001345 [Crocinitomicaceae bacterium]|jgi:hypothetical protein
MIGPKLHKTLPFSIRLQYGYYQFFDHFLGRDRFFKWTRKSRGRFYKKLTKRLKESGPGKAIPVERLTDCSYEDFMNNYVKKGIPVILDGAAQDWKCTNEWSLQYFKDLHGDDKIIFMDHEDIAKGYEDTTLGEVIDDIQGGKGKYYRFYPLLTEHPEHLLDFDYEWMRKRKHPRSFGEAFHVFISGKNGFTPLHNASSQNLFIQIHGEKKWMLYPNDYACVVDPAPARNMYRSAPIRNGKDFNPFENNFIDYPLFEYVDHYSVHLKAGDVFYNPPYMWHAVQNPTDSIGVGYRYFTPLKSYATAPLYFFLEMFAFNPPVWKSWRNYDDINLIHLLETGMIKDVAKKKGVKKMKKSINQ